MPWCACMECGAVWWGYTASTWGAGDSKSWALDFGASGDQCWQAGCWLLSFLLDVMAVSAFCSLHHSANAHRFWRCNAISIWMDLKTSPGVGGWFVVEQSYCISVQCVPVGRWRLMSQPVVAPLPNKKLECSCHTDTAHISVSASEGVANIPLRRCEVAMWCKLSWHHCEQASWHKS